MVDAGVQSIQLGDLIRPGARAEQEVRDQAFRLWIEYGRSVRRVCESTGLGESAVRKWMRVDNWQQRRLDQAASFLPGASVESAFSLKLACYNAAARLQQIAFDAYEYGVEPNHREVQSLCLIIDRGGFAPSNPASPLNQPMTSNQEKPELPDFSTMSNEELRAYEQQLRQRRRS